MTVAPTSPAVSTVLTKVVSGVFGLVALAAASWGVYLLVVGAADSGDEDSLAGLAFVIGIVVLAVALPVLGLSAAVVLSRNRIVVGVCGLLLAIGVGLVALVALGNGGSAVTMVAILAAVTVGVSSVLSLATPRPV